MVMIGSSFPSGIWPQPAPFVSSTEIWANRFVSLRSLRCKNPLLSGRMIATVPRVLAIIGHGTPQIHIARVWPHDGVHGFLSEYHRADSDHRAVPEVLSVEFQRVLGGRDHGSRPGRLSADVRRFFYCGARQCGFRNDPGVGAAALRISRQTAYRRTGRFSLRAADRG